MIGGDCALCGQPATGFAMIGDKRFCHGDGEREPTCYMRSQWRLRMGDVDREFESDYANFVLNPDPEDLLEQVDLERKRVKESGCDCMAVNLPAVDGHCPICRRPK